MPSIIPLWFRVVRKGRFPACGQLLQPFLMGEHNESGVFPLLSNTKTRIRKRMMPEKFGSELGVRSKDFTIRPTLNYNCPSAYACIHLYICYTEKFLTLSFFSAGPGPTCG